MATDKVGGLSARKAGVCTNQLFTRSGHGKAPHLLGFIGPVNPSASGIQQRAHKGYHQREPVERACPGYPIAL